MRDLRIPHKETVRKDPSSYYPPVFAPYGNFPKFLDHFLPCSLLSWPLHERRPKIATFFFHFLTSWMTPSIKSSVDVNFFPHTASIDTNWSQEIMISSNMMEFFLTRTQFHTSCSESVIPEIGSFRTNWFLGTAAHPALDLFRFLSANRPCECDPFHYREIQKLKNAQLSI